MCGVQCVPQWHKVFAVDLFEAGGVPIVHNGKVLLVHMLCVHTCDHVMRYTYTHFHTQIDIDRQTDTYEVVEGERLVCKAQPEDMVSISTERCCAFDQHNITKVKLH